jgi:hypothetical protein
MKRLLARKNTGMGLRCQRDSERASGRNQGLNCPFKTNRVFLTVCTILCLTSAIKSSVRQTCAHPSYYSMFCRSRWYQAGTKPISAAVADRILNPFAFTCASVAGGSSSKDSVLALESGHFGQVSAASLAAIRGSNLYIHSMHRDLIVKLQRKTH